jgi:hypothetical protein
MFLLKAFLPQDKICGLATGMLPVDLWHKEVPSKQQRGFVTFARQK